MEYYFDTTVNNIYSFKICTKRFKDTYLISAYILMYFKILNLLTYVINLFLNSKFVKKIVLKLNFF